jgi:hypothetical protein
MAYTKVGFTIVAPNETYPKAQTVLVRRLGYSVTVTRAAKTSDKDTKYGFYTE